MNGKAINVLYIEDNPADAELIQEMLSEATQLGWDLPRFEVEHVGRLDAGLERLEAAASGEGARIDVVLSDLDLPDSRAGETLITLRAHFPHLPTVVLTGREDEKMARKSVRAGAEDYIFKREMSGSLLAHSLIYAIQRQENRRALQEAHDELEQQVEKRTEELRQANAALRESRARYRAISELTSDFAYAVRMEPDGTYTPEWMTRPLDSLTSYLYDEMQARGGWQSLIHPEDRPVTRRYFQTLLSGQPDEVEFRIVTRDGETRWVRNYSRPIWDESEGRVVRIIGAAQDITERRRIKEALKQRTAQLEMLREGALEVTAELDLDVLLRAIASRAMELLGGVAGGIYLYRPGLDALEWVTAVGDGPVPPGSILRRCEGLSGKVWELGEPLVVDDYQQWEGRAAKYDGLPLQAVIGVPIRHSDDFLGVLTLEGPHEPRPGEGETANAFSENDVELLGFFATQAAIAIRNARLYEKAQQEIAKRRQVEKILWRRNRELTLLNQAGQALSSSLDVDELLNTVLEGVRDLLMAKACSIWLIDPQTEEIVCRQATGRQSEKVRGWRLARGQGIVGQVASRGERLILPDAKADEQHFPGVDQATGLETRSLLSIPLRTEERVLGVIQAIDNEVDRFDEADARLLDSLGASAALAIEKAQLYEQAQQEIAERRRVEEALSRSNADLERYAYAISHDLREPLRVATGYLQLLENRYAGQLDARASRYIEHATGAMDRMKAMTQALLELSRVERKGQPFAPTDCEAVLEDVLDDLAIAIHESDAEVTRDRLPTVMADEAQLAMVFQNLIANAIKFRKEDEPPRVHVSAERGEGRKRGESVWLFSVEDNGIGIDRGQTDRIFGIFQRLHTEEEYPGLGIGLAHCRRIVERHGGRIWVASEPGQGSTFYLTLPA